MLNRTFWFERSLDARCVGLVNRDFRRRWANVPTNLYFPAANIKKHTQFNMCHTSYSDPTPICLTNSRLPSQQFSIFKYAVQENLWYIHISDFKHTIYKHTNREKSTKKQSKSFIIFVPQLCWYLALGIMWWYSQLFFLKWAPVGLHQLTTKMYWARKVISMMQSSNLRFL